MASVMETARAVITAMGILYLPMTTPPAPPTPAVPRPRQGTSALPDPNRMTDSRIIQFLPLADAERYSFEIQHRQAWNFYQARRYYDAIAKFAEMSASYAMNCLSPYWAGMCALRLNDRDAAAEWFSLSLQINPAYQPASDELSRMGRL
jgi:TolA-binding protein